MTDHERGIHHRELSLLDLGDELAYIRQYLGEALASLQTTDQTEEVGRARRALEIARQRVAMASEELRGYQLDRTLHALAALD